MNKKNAPQKIIIAPDLRSNSVIEHSKNHVNFPKNYFFQGGIIALTVNCVNLRGVNLTLIVNHCKGESGAVRASPAPFSAGATAEMEVKAQPGQAGTKKDQSRKHEMTKTRNKSKQLFVFSNFRVFVLRKSSIFDSGWAGWVHPANTSYKVLTC